MDSLSYQLTLASHLSCFASLMLRVRGFSRSGLFFVTMLALNCSRIHLSHSFFCHEIYQILRSHHTTIIYTHSPHSLFHTNIMYIHSTIYNYLVTTTTSVINILQNLLIFFFFLRNCRLMRILARCDLLCPIPMRQESHTIKSYGQT